MIVELFALLPEILLFFVLLWSVSFPETEYRRKIILILMITVLVFNTLNLVVFIAYEIISTEFNLSLNMGTLFLSEIIIGLGIITLYFSKDEMRGIVNEHIFDMLIIFIVMCLVGAVITLNILVVIIFTILTQISLSMIFYFGHYSKAYELLKKFLLTTFISALCLILAVFLIFLESSSFILTDISAFEFNPISNFIISFLFLFGFGIPCGIFPFALIRVKNYYQDSSYTYLFAYTNLAIPVIALILNKILISFSYGLSLVPLSIILIASLGLIISLTYSLTEIFTSIDGKSYSIKKILGYSTNSDFNIILLVSAYIGLLPTGIITAGYWDYVFLFLFLLILIKSLLFYSLKPIFLETLDDNIKLLGGFFNKYKIFGAVYLISGLFLSIPFLVGNSILGLILPLLTAAVIDIPQVSFVGVSIFVILILYFTVTLIWISITFNDIFFGVDRYLKNKKIRSLNKFDYIPLVILLAVLSFLCIFYILNNQLYLQTINFFSENFIY